MSIEPTPGPYDKIAYLIKLNEARDQLVLTKRLVLDWVSKLDEHAAASFMMVEPLTKSFPRKVGDETFRLVYEIHTTDKRYANLGVSLRSARVRDDLIKLAPNELKSLLAKHCGPSNAKSFASSIVTFARFNARLSALRVFGVCLEPTQKSGLVLPRWFKSLHAYGLNCRPFVEAAFDDFIALSTSLDEAIFDFNSAIGKARYRSIRCTYVLDEFDPLGPAHPSIKVITSFNPAKQKFRYNHIEDFKKTLKKKQVTKELSRSLGQLPTKAEVSEALQTVRNRPETPWITKRVIKACYLGRHTTPIFQAQENLVAVMQPWTSLRAKLQALLP
jgi:hypothetical protein